MVRSETLDANSRNKFWTFGFHFHNQIDMKALCSLFAGFGLAFQVLSQRMTFPLLLLILGLIGVQPCAGQIGTWTPTGSLNIGRVSHTATLLLDGRVLVCG